MCFKSLLLEYTKTVYCVDCLLYLQKSFAQPMPDLCPKNIVIFAGINEFNSSFCAILSHCLSKY